MADFIELGMEGADKLIDKHFDKVPNQAFHPDHPLQKTVHGINPMNLSRRHRQKHYGAYEHTPTGSESDSERSDMELERRPRRTATRTPPRAPESAYSTHPQYSRQPPRVRPEYMPVGTNVYAPESPGLARAREDYDRNIVKARRDWDENYHSDSARPAPRRPKAITRRSSSHPAQDRRHHDHSSVSRESRAEHLSNKDKARDKAHRYGLKEETLGRFGTGPAAVTGSVLGALVGGWAANKAQVATGRDQNDGRRRDNATNKAITLLGAAVGGLAVNAAMEQYQKGKEETEVKEDKWEKKFGKEDDDDGGSAHGSRSGRREGGARRSRRDRDGSDEDDTRSAAGSRSGRRASTNVIRREGRDEGRERYYRDTRDPRRYQQYDDRY